MDSTMFLVEVWTEGVGLDVSTRKEVYVVPLTGAIYGKPDVERAAKKRHGNDHHVRVTVIAGAAMDQEGWIIRRR